MALTVIGLLDGLLVDDPIDEAEQTISSVAAPIEAAGVLGSEVGTTLLGSIGCFARSEARRWTVRGLLSAGSIHLSDHTA